MERGHASGWVVVPWGGGYRFEAWVGGNRRFGIVTNEDHARVCAQNLLDEMRRASELRTTGAPDA